MDLMAHKRQQPDSDDDIDASTLFRAQENFPKFIIIESTNKETQVTSLSPFVIEKQIESMIGTPKSVKKLKNGTLLVETTRKMQTDILLKSKKFFNLPVEVKPHKTLNSSKGIIRDRNLKGESEKNILEYLENQGVTAVKRFTVKKGQDTINTNTILLTFDSVVPPKSLKIFYQIIPVDLYIPNPLRCFQLSEILITVRNFDTMRTNAQLTPGQSVKNVVWETMTIIQITAKTPQNVSTVAEHIYHGQMNAKHGRRKKKSCD